MFQLAKIYAISTLILALIVEEEVDLEKVMAEKENSPMWSVKFVLSLDI